MTFRPSSSRRRRLTNATRRRTNADRRRRGALASGRGASAFAPPGARRSGCPLYAVASRDRHRSTAAHRRGARRVDAVSHLAGAAVDSRRRRDQPDRRRERAERGRRRGADPRHDSRAQPRGAAQPGGHRVDLRRARRRAHPMRHVPRSSRRRRHLPHDSGARDFGRTARAVARDPGAVRRSRRPRARRRPALERQVDAHLRVRRSDQPHAQRSRHHAREPDQVRAREPRLARQPARSARRPQRLVAVARAALRENPDVLVDRRFRLAGNRDAGARGCAIRATS